MEVVKKPEDHKHQTEIESPTGPPTTATPADDFSDLLDAGNEANVSQTQTESDEATFARETPDIQQTIVDRYSWAAPRPIPGVKLIEEYVIGRSAHSLMMMGLNQEEAIKEATNGLAKLRSSWNRGVRFPQEGTLLHIGDSLLSSTKADSTKRMAKFLVRLFPIFKSGAGYGVLRLGVTDRLIAETYMEEAFKEISAAHTLSVLTGKDLSKMPPGEATKAFMPLFTNSELLQKMVTKVASKYGLDISDLTGLLG